MKFAVEERPLFCSGNICCHKNGPQSRIFEPELSRKLPKSFGQVFPFRCAAQASTLKMSILDLHAHSVLWSITHTQEDPSHLVFLDITKKNNRSWRELRQTRKTQTYISFVKFKCLSLSCFKPGITERGKFCGLPPAWTSFDICRCAAIPVGDPLQLSVLVICYVTR